ncbi:MAG TPA: hypothetical protein VF635_02670, partial [Propionibacteriaceae bacterium]
MDWPAAVSASPGSGSPSLDALGEGCGVPELVVLGGDDQHGRRADRWDCGSLNACGAHLPTAQVPADVSKRILLGGAGV